MKRAILWFILSVFSGSPLTADTLTLPKPTGIYSVGTKAIELRDPSRTMLRGHEPRRWMVQAYYPSTHPIRTYPYRPGTLADGTVEGVKALAYAEPDAEIIKEHIFPVIISFPGRGNERQHYTILCEELASHGYIVLAMDQAYVANFVKFPDGTTIVLTLKDAWNLPRDRDYRYTYDDEIIDAAIKDVDFVLENFRAFGDLSISFDISKIIIMGHSIGANIAHIKGFDDKRIKAVVDIDSKITERAVFGHIGVPPNPDGKPVLFIRGMMQYQEDVGDQLTKIPNSTIWSPYAQHSAFSDDAYFAAKIPHYGQEGFLKNAWNWLLKRGPFFSNVDTNLGEKDVDTWFKEYTDYIREWLDTRVSYLNGN